MKAILPAVDLREIIYDAIVRELGAVNIGISLNNLSRNIANNADLNEVTQPSIYKILYGLFRNRTFVCLDSYNQYNPVIADLSIKREEMDSAFIKSVLTVFKRESRGILFDSTAWSLYFYDDEDHAELIDDLNDQMIRPAGRNRPPRNPVIYAIHSPCLLQAGDLTEASYGSEAVLGVQGQLGFVWGF